MIDASSLLSQEGGRGGERKKEGESETAEERGREREREKWRERERERERESGTSQSKRGSSGDLSRSGVLLFPAQRIYRPRNESKNAAGFIKSQEFGVDFESESSADCIVSLFRAAPRSIA